MFVIELIYKKPLAELDAAMGVHMKFLKKYYDAGTFLISGSATPGSPGRSPWPISCRTAPDSMTRS